MSVLIEKTFEDMKVGETIYKSDILNGTFEACVINAIEPIYDRFVYSISGEPESGFYSGYSLNKQKRLKSFLFNENTIIATSKERIQHEINQHIERMAAKLAKLNDIKNMISNF